MRYWIKMKNSRRLLVAVCFLCFSLLGKAQEAMLFSGGYLYNDIKEHANTVKTSGFNVLTLWSLHISDKGDFYFNDTPIISDGEYIGHSWWPDEVKKLKGEGSSVQRIEFSVGAWSVPDFENIQTLIEEQGTGPESILYRNFKLLIELLDLDAIDFDDESNYDVASTVEYSKMLIGLGCNITLCPYTETAFWESVFKQVEDFRPGTIDRIYLQCYAGGADNDPKDWNVLFNGMNVIPGLWGKNGEDCSLGDSPEIVQKKLSAWNKNSPIEGGFIWVFDDLEKCGKQTSHDYAKAILDALK